MTVRRVKPRRRRVPGAAPRGPGQVPNSASVSSRMSCVQSRAAFEPATGKAAASTGASCAICRICNSRCMSPGRPVLKSRSHSASSPIRRRSRRPLRRRETLQPAGDGGLAAGIAGEIAGRVGAAEEGHARVPPGQHRAIAVRGAPPPPQGCRRFASGPARGGAPRPAALPCGRTPCRPVPPRA